MLEVAGMMKRGSHTVGGAVTGVDRPMDEREAYAVQRCFRVSLVLGLILAAAAYLTILRNITGVEPIVYAVFGVFGFSTLVAFMIFNGIISIDRHITARRLRREAADRELLRLAGPAQPSAPHLRSSAS